MATIPWIGQLGLEYDEAHFLPAALKIANGAEEYLQLPWGFTVAHRPIPFMTMPYVGSLDALVYAVPYRLFGPGVVVSRSCNLLLGFLILLLTYRVARREAGLWAGALALGLLLADVEWMVHVPTNFGPFLLQQLFAIAAIACLQQWWQDAARRYFFAAIILLALGFHEKLTFLWVLTPLIAAILVFRAKPTFRQARWWMYPAALLLALAILAPILYFIHAEPEVVLGFGKQNTSLPVDWGATLSERWRVFDLMLRGTSMMDFTAGPGTNPISRGPALMALFFGGLLLAIFRRERMALTLYATAIGVWVWNLLFPEAGRMHHLLLIAPLWQAGAAISLGGANRTIRLVGFAALLWAGVDAARCYRWHAHRVALTGGIDHWSDMTVAATAWLKAQPNLEAVTTSWGIANPVFVQSGGSRNVQEYYLDKLPDALTPEAAADLNRAIDRARIVWLISDVMPRYGAQWNRIVELAAARQRSPKLVAQFPSRDDRVHIRAYRFDTEEAAPSRWIEAEPTGFDLPLRWRTVRVTMAGVAGDMSEGVNLEWMSAAGETVTSDYRPLGWIPQLKDQAVFEFGRDFWPKTFTRSHQKPGEIVRAKVNATLLRARISSVEVGLR